MSERNNQEKLSAPQPEQGASSVPDVPKQIRQDDNPFSFLKETMVIDLPSKGKYYTDENLKGGEIEIYLMNASHEDILSNKNYIRKNIVINKFLDSIIVDKSINHEKLLAADRSAIMYESRKVAYGPEFTSNIKCKACGTFNEEKISLNNAVSSEGESSDECFVTSDNMVKVRLPVASSLSERDFYIELRMTNGEMESKIKSILDQKDAGFSNTLELLVVDVDGHKDMSTIKKFLRIMRAGDSQFIKQNYKKACPNITLLHDFECQNVTCNNVVSDMEVGITANFFWPEL